MTPSGQTICLCMIVRNEAPVIGRCLASALPLIDHWLIVDTGSDDGTQAIILDAMADIPGQLAERPWVDFAHNRSEALALAQPLADYTLIIDADDEFIVPPDFVMPALSEDSYTVEIEDGDTVYRRTQLVRNRLPWRYKGVLHEFLTCDEARTCGHAPFRMRRNHDGRRRRDQQRTYQRDAALLENALRTETDAFMRARYTFYLAQSYRDCGNLQPAIDAYLRRAGLGFWDQEVFVSLYQAGVLMERLGQDADLVLATYERATQACPFRAEAAHAASRLCRLLGRNEQGYAIAKPLVDVAAPPDGLFVETWVYQTGLRDEFAVNAYWAGHYRDSLDACLKLLAQADLPDRDRIAANANFALSKLREDQTGPIPDILIWPAGPPAPAITLPGPAILPSARVSGLVSVITPTRNRARHLKRALTWFNRQTYPDLEWLILDDSPERPEPLEGLDTDRINYTYTSRQLTIGEKRNALIDRARGEIIVQFDDDDYYAPNYVSAMVGALQSTNADLINLRGWFLYDFRAQFFGYWDLMQKEGPHYRCGPDGVTLKILTPETNADFNDNHLGFGFTYAFKRKVWDAAKFPAVNWNEDGIFSLAAAAAFTTTGFHDTTGLCLHVLHEGSTSHCFPQYHLPAFLLDRLFPEFR